MTSESDNEEAPSDNKRRLNFRTEGFVIAGGTLLGYLAAYRFEVGIADYWDIPRSLIDVTLVSVVGAAFAIFFFLGLLFFYLNPAVILFGSVLAGEDSTFRRAILLHLFMAGALVGAIFVFGWDPVALASMVALFLFLDTIGLFVPWLWMRFAVKDHGGFFDRVHRFWNDPSEPPDSYQLASRATGIRHGWLLFGLLFVVGFYHLAWGAGYREARSETQYLVDEESRLALIRRYGDVYVFRAFTAGDQAKFCGDVVLITQTELSGRRLQERSIVSKEKDEWPEQCGEQKQAVSGLSQ